MKRLRERQNDSGHNHDHDYTFDTYALVDQDLQKSRHVHHHDTVTLPAQNTANAYNIYISEKLNLKRCLLEVGYNILVTTTSRG